MNDEPMINDLRPRRPSVRLTTPAARMLRVESNREQARRESPAPNRPTREERRLAERDAELHDMEGD